MVTPSGAEQDIAARHYLPDEWIDNDERRAKAGIPLDVGFQTKPSLALDQIRAAVAAGVPPGVVLADEVYGSSAAFRQGVAALGLDYAVAARSTQEGSATAGPTPCPPLAR